MNTKVYWSLAFIVLLFAAVFTYGSFSAVEPAVGTVEAVVDETGVTLRGVISDQGGKEISSYGFKWGTSTDPEKEKSFTKTIQDDLPFSAIISDLTEGTTYYYQAFAVNSKGTGYGEIKNFTVPVNEAPAVSFSNPDEKLTVTSAEPVHISAAATDDKKVTAMELYINDKSKVGTDSDSLAYDWDTDGVEPGEYIIKATASDGSKQGEEVIKLTVKEKIKDIPVTVASADPVVANNKAEVSSSIPVSRGTDYSAEYPKLSKVNGLFGQFRYKDTKGGRIEINPAWVKENIVTIKLPGLNQYVQVHKDAKDNFIQAFNYIKNGTATINGQEVSLLSLIKTMDGTFVSRHVNWDPNRGLSNHSWGTAIDINASDHFRYVNPAKEPYDPNLILWEKAFKPAGFSWGNSYSDAMHYELFK